MASNRSSLGPLLGVVALLAGCFFLVAGVTARLGNPARATDLVDGVVIVVLCVVVGAVLLRRRGRDQ